MEQILKMKTGGLLIALFLVSHVLYPMSDGHGLWLEYRRVSDEVLLQHYRERIRTVHLQGASPTLEVVRKELGLGLESLLGKEPLFKAYDGRESSLVVSLYDRLPPALQRQIDSKGLGTEGFAIKEVAHNGQSHLILTAREEIGLLYGSFHFLRLLQTHKSLKDIDIVESPKVDIRMLNNWDNLDRTIERGYSGFSIWNWHTLPDYIDPRYIEYARANASVGINGTALTSVNANALILTPHYLEKVKALADLFRPY